MTICYHCPQVRYVSLAEMHGTPVRRYASGRRCANPGCHGLLSAMNPGPVCYACQKSRQERERARAVASSGGAVAARTAPLPAPRASRPPGPPLRTARGTDGITRAEVLAMLPVGVRVCGAEIARHLGLSRSAVAKHVRNLCREGHTVEVFAGRMGGYRRAS